MHSIFQNPNLTYGTVQELSDDYTDVTDNYVITDLANTEVWDMIYRDGWWYLIVSAYISAYERHDRIFILPVRPYLRLLHRHRHLVHQEQRSHGPVAGQGQGVLHQHVLRRTAQHGRPAAVRKQQQRQQRSLRLAIRLRHLDGRRQRRQSRQPLGAADLPARREHQPLGLHGAGVRDRRPSDTVRGRRRRGQCDRVQRTGELLLGMRVWHPRLQHPLSVLPGAQVGECLGDWCQYCAAEVCITQPVV